VIVLGIEKRKVELMLRKGPKEFRKGAVNALRSASVKVVKTAQANLTSARYGKPVSTTGNLRASITFKIKSGILETVIGSFSTTYAHAVHEGRRAGKAPPSRALELWVKMKGLAKSPSDIKRVAFAIAQKQKKEEVPAKPFLDDAWEARKGEILVDFVRRIDDVARKLNRRNP
jgi:phage gpG-like protein